MIRIGHGMDIHAFGGVKDLILGGIKIPFDKGILAHSDGDVACHSLIDALFGAAAMGDIGKFFPDTDKKYENIDSRYLLREAWASVRVKGYHIGNIDLTIFLQKPKVRPYIDQIRANLAEDTHCRIEQVSVKATTTERLGFIGSSRGIACEAVVLLLDRLSLESPTSIV